MIFKKFKESAMPPLEKDLNNQTILFAVPNTF